jgi:hypothetical protein
VALIVGSRGNFCTGVALARDLVLTVAHCVIPGADYKRFEHDAENQPILRDIAQIVRHPQFELKALSAHRATADVALLKLAQPADLAPALLARQQDPVAVGDRFLVAGYGVAVRGDGRTGGRVRAATLSTTGQPGGLQIRLLDPNSGTTGGLGACTGDSGAGVCAVRTPDGDRARELVDRPRPDRRLWRTDRRHPARALPGMDHRAGRQARQPAAMKARRIAAERHSILKSLGRFGSTGRHLASTA